MTIIKKTFVFKKWFNKLNKNVSDELNINITRVAYGNFSNCQSVGGGVHELKINYQKGYRIYFANIDGEIILLLIGGDKKTQDKDIKKAKKLKEFYVEK
ncbi:MAG: type II toxin-antitoxin system RelE/ParE family toxin [Elusimicrobiota bacterium]|jgi:putative addiction module killer protein|nr:type II toxin-antitoxin system RelE/ParE family toxin [Elusimicrobiota bacterium]